MADNLGNNSNVSGQLNRNSMTSDDRIDALNSSIQELIDVLGSGRGMSMSNFKDQSADDKWRPNRNSRTNNDNKKFKHHSKGNPLDDIEDGIVDGLLEAVTGGNFKKQMNSAMNTFAKEFGVNIKDLPYELGKEMFKQSGIGKTIGKKFASSLESGADKFLSNVFKDKVGGDAAKDGLMKTIKSFLGDAGSVGGDVAEAGGQLAQQAMSVGEGMAQVGSEVLSSGAVVAEGGAAIAEGSAVAAGGAAAAGTALGGLAAVVPPLLIALAAFMAIAAVLGPTLEGLGDVIKALSGSALRGETDRAKRVEAAQKRLESDIQYMAKLPFDILTEAANEWYNTWDSNLSQISLTQGYTKEAVYDLYSSFAERLRADGLDSVVSATSISDNLSKVLGSGLSGKVAEEFAYIATVLSEAVPTEDFFNYASSYAELAANAIANGYSQDEALQYANEQLTSFASNLLYSSRELAGGFSTGLQNASDLFEQSVQIAQSAKSNDTTLLSGTLTSISAVIGAVAPDLASGLVSAVVGAATGGNSDSIVALRSLAGINASNTEFLKAISEDPQAIFTELFTNLAQMQNMSESNYMEVAEGLADVFGIDSAAFARVDFNYLAQAISEMNTNSSSLQENLSLLATGESTTTAEQAKMRQINEMILEEGLAYVIDNDAARMIQEHMWDEQLAIEMQSATYSIELASATMSLFEGIAETIHIIMMILNPIGAASEMIENIATTVQETAQYEQDIADLLDTGKVGFNSQSLYNLTTRGQLLNLTDNIVSLYGGNRTTASSGISSALDGISNGLNYIGRYTGGTTGLFSRLGWTPGSAADATYSWLSQQASHNPGGGAYSYGESSITSAYNWSTVGKSTINALGTSAIGSLLDAVDVEGKSQAAKNARSISNQKFKNFLDSVLNTNMIDGDAKGGLVSNATSYKDWVSNAKELYGVEDIDEALAQFGMTKAELESTFNTNLAKAQAAVTEARAKDEVDFRDETRGFWDFNSGSSGVFETAIWNPFYADGAKYDTTMAIVNAHLEEIKTEKLGNTSKSDSVIGLLQLVNDNIVKFMKDWTDYYINHTTYSSRTSGLLTSEWNDLVRYERESSEETSLALAKALTSITDQASLDDPTVQTNVLLGKIVIILEAIMQQNNSTGGLSLIDSLSALSLGITT